MENNQERINCDLTDPAAFRTNLLETIGKKPERMTNAQVLEKVEMKIAELKGERIKRVMDEVKDGGDVITPYSEWLTIKDVSFMPSTVTALSTIANGLSTIKLTVHVNLNGDHVEIPIIYRDWIELEKDLERIRMAAFGGGPINE